MKNYNFPIYLTKCNCCGNINSWSGGLEGEKWTIDVMYLYAENTTKILDCKHCKLDNTIQEVVAFVNPKEKAI